MSQNPIESLKSFDRENKPRRANETNIMLGQLYDDSAGPEILRRLEALGVGLKAMENPLAIGMLRRIIDRLAVVYDNPPTRWLRKGKRRLSENSPAHENMVDVLERASYDLTWRRIDKMRALYRQIFGRIYASDPRGSVRLSIFEPFNVLRRFDPSAADQIEMDTEFALCLSVAGTKEQWEHWTKIGDTEWSMTIVDEKGVTIRRPFDSTSDVCPYGAELPVFSVYDELPCGRAWLAPRASRESWSFVINAIAADLHSLTVHQAHARQIFNLDDPETAPKSTGHGGAFLLNKDETYRSDTPNAKILECEQVMSTFIRLFCSSEDLPAGEHDKDQVPITGAALKVREGALNARREAQVPLAAEDERTAYRKLRAVHNLHAGSNPAWDLPALDEAPELEVEVADVRTPTDPKELQLVAFADVAAGVASAIDYIQARDGCSRSGAIETYQRVQEDRALYPTQAIAAASGPRQAGTTDQINPAPAAGPNGVGLAERAGTPSVIDAMTALKQAQRVL